MLWADDLFKPETLPSWLLSFVGVVAATIGGVIIKSLGRWRRDTEEHYKWTLEHIKLHSDESRKNCREEIAVLVAAFEKQQQMERDTCERRHRENSGKLESLMSVLTANQETLLEQSAVLRVAVAELRGGKKGTA